MRDHEGIVIDKFNGLYQRGSEDEVPLDHFTDCNNLRFIAGSSFGTRYGIGISQDVDVPLENVKRIYNYPTQSDNTLIVLTYDYDTDEGKIYHVVNSQTVFGPVLTIVGMTDFAFVPYAGRAYISPFSSSLAVSASPAASLTATLAAGVGVETGSHDYAFTFVTATGETTPSPLASLTMAGGNHQGDLTDIAVGPPGTLSRKVYRSEANLSALKLLTTLADNTTTVFQDNTADASLTTAAPVLNTATIGTLTVEKGLQGEFLYVYAGDGTAARKAAGIPITGNMTIANGAAGHTDAGVHLFGIVAETISGFLTPPGALEAFTTSANLSVSFGNIPTSGDPNIVARHLVATRAIVNYNGDLEGYEYFFVPNATIPNNTDTFLNDISFFDADLLEDADHLFDNYAEIPAGASLSIYHNRLILATTFTDISLILVSELGEPEAINQISGLLVVTLDGNPITQTQEMRDVLYVMKRSKTTSYVDSGDVPSSWPETVIDNALGCPVHGCATVLDSGSSSVDFLIVATYQNITLFNGKYISLELGWKIEAFWKAQDRDFFKNIQIVNAPIQKEIYIVLPDHTMLIGNYANGMDDKRIRWSPFSAIMPINTVAIVHIDEIILGSDLVEV